MTRRRIAVVGLGLSIVVGLGLYLAVGSVMLPRAELLWHSGYVVLAPDLQAHGESTGDRITFGYLEARDAETCLLYLNELFPGLHVGACGVSG